MSRRTIWGVILLGCCVIALLFLAFLCVQTVTELRAIAPGGIDLSADSLPGASLIGAILAYSVAWGGLMLFGFPIAFCGWVASLAAVKIVPNDALRRLSIGFAAIFTVGLLILIAISIFFVQSVL